MKDWTEDLHGREEGQCAEYFREAQEYETPLSLVDLINAIADEATVRHHDSQSDETLVECKVCGQWEGHSDLCPIPAIRKWLDN